LLLQIRRPFEIGFGSSVVTRLIQFDDQSCLVAKEICDKWPDGVLTPELESTQLARSRAVPF
jgi:hypothetical protein